MGFQKAVRKNIPAKIFIDGPSGSGKSKGALLLAKGLAGGGKIAGLDSENKRLSMFADEFDFDVENVSNNNPDEYIACINSATREGYKVLIIDSISPVWHWALECVDNASGNDFSAWNKPKAEIKKLTKAIRDSSIHIISTCRSKEDYVLEERENKKGYKVQVPRKLGLAPEFEKGFSYEFAFCFSVDSEHKAICTKDVPGLSFESSEMITEEYGVKIRKWLEEGLSFEDEYNILYGTHEDKYLLEFLKHRNPNKHPAEITMAVKKWLVDNSDGLKKEIAQWEESKLDQETETEQTESGDK